LIWNASILFFIEGGRLFTVPPDLSGAVSLTILYGTATVQDQEPSLAEFPFLSIGNFNLPVSESWGFCISGLACSEPLFRGISGLFTLLPDAGLYQIIAEGAVRGFLGPSREENTFQVLSNGSFFSEAYFNDIPATPSRTLSSAWTPKRTSPSTPAPTFTLAPASTELATPFGPERVEGRGINAAAIVVPIVVVLVIVIVAVVCWRRRHRKMSESEYRDVDEWVAELRLQ
jgi:hypothetical protein